MKPICVRLGWVVGFAAVLLVACGGSNNAGDAGGTGGAGNAAPTVALSEPAAGLTFRAGDTIGVAGSATDAGGAPLPASGLSWWVDLHHDDHTHPLQLPTAGAGGSVSIPVRGETSDNVWVRFHFRATDSAGRTSDVARDVLPQKAQISVTSSPAGLRLSLDGQPVTTPHAFSGVVGIERDLGAADQSFNGRRYRFASWSDGMAASHTIATPAADTTYTATFTDLGPVVVNQPPTVAVVAPANASVGVAVGLSAIASDSDGTIARVEFFDGDTLLGSVASSPHALTWTPTTAGQRSITARATDDGGAATTSAVAAVTVAPSGNADTTAPTVALTAPANLATGLTGMVSLAATAADDVGVAGVEFQVDGSTVGSEVTSAPYQRAFDSSGYTPGQHVVRARARDAAGNLSPWAIATVRLGGTRSVPLGFSKDEVHVTGLDSAVAFAQAPDGRLLVAEQGGRLRVVKNAALLPTPFVQLAVDSSGERGLLGVAFHPNFASNGWVYVYYTTASGGTHNRISRFVAGGDVASGAENVLVDLPALSGANNHNGGALHFGVDGKLYVGVGDNANGANSPNLNSPLGKLLRFNDDGSIPNDNPFCTTAGQQSCAVWARGLRNPFTFAVQPGTGRIHINDVGQNAWEEINLGVPGADYGWPASEGGDNIAAGMTAPLFAYKHSDASPAGSGPGGFFTGFSIAGGSFYPGSGNFPPAYRDSYYFADYVSRFIGRLDLANGNSAYAFASVAGSPVDMLAGGDGALYVLTRSAITRISAP
ncbi:MAG: PQQ-dependent sugar dehydrogenase [Rhizobacter sp.]|nr:PQQ-dependent sugar dehydrogenase [Rhizobacter sp.]